jgi:hypothetical protein
VKIHLCTLAARRIREQYVNIDLINTHISLCARDEEEYEEVWCAIGEWLKVDQWLEDIFEDIEVLVKDSEEGFLQVMKANALSEIQAGREAMKRMRKCLPSVLHWCRYRAPKLG